MKQIVIDLIINHSGEAMLMVILIFALAVTATWRQGS